MSPSRSLTGSSPGSASTGFQGAAVANSGHPKPSDDIPASIGFGDSPGFRASGRPTVSLKNRETEALSRSRIFGDSHLPGSAFAADSREFRSSLAVAQSLRLDYSESFDVSDELTASNAPAPSASFTNSASFPASASPASSNSFPPSASFTGSDPGSASGGFTASPVFDSSNRIVSSESIGASSAHPDSLDFDPSAPFYLSDALTGSSGFTASTRFSGSKLLAHSGAVNPTKQVGRSNDFYSGSFEGSQKFSASPPLSRSLEFRSLLAIAESLGLPDSGDIAEPKVRQTPPFSGGANHGPLRNTGRNRTARRLLPFSPFQMALRYRRQSPPVVHLPVPAVSSDHRLPRIQIG